VEQEAAEMAENKSKPTKLSMTGFIDSLTDPVRRRDAKTLVELMQSVAGEKPKMWGPSLIGFGIRHYVYDSGRKGDSPVIACSPRKSATVLYGIIGFAEATPLLAKLGSHTTGKGCLYIKKFADWDQHVLQALMAKSQAAQRRPT
jgi:hypothetical protein